MPSSANKKRDNQLINLVIPILLTLVGFGFVAAVAELLTFSFPSLKMHYYLGFFSIIITFLGYFATVRPESADKKRSRIPEVMALIFLSKLYTFFVFPFDYFLKRLKISKFIEANFFFAFVCLYFVWVLARTAGKLATTMTHFMVDKELKEKYDESYVGRAEKEDVTGLKMVRLLFIPMIVLLCLVILVEQSLPQKMLEETFFRYRINIFGGIMAAATIAMATLALYLKKMHQWDREKAQVDKDLGPKWVFWSLIIVLLFSIVSAIFPDDLSPVYFDIANGIKALLPFIHREQKPTESVFQKRESEPLPTPEVAEQQMVKTSYAFLAAIAASVRIALFLLVAGVALYHVVRAFSESRDELPGFVRKIIETLEYFFKMIKNLFKGIKPATSAKKRTIAEQVSELLRRKRVPYNRANINEIRKLYAELLLEANARGIQREAYSTASEFAATLEKIFPEEMEEISAVTKLYEDARYNKDPDEDASSKAKGIFGKVIGMLKGYSKKDR